MIVEIDTLQIVKVDKFSCRCSKCDSDNIEIAVDLESYKDTLEVKEEFSHTEKEYTIDGIETDRDVYDYSIGESTNPDSTGHTMGNPILVIVCNNCKVREDIRISY